MIPKKGPGIPLVFSRSCKSSHLHSPRLASHDKQRKVERVRKGELIVNMMRMHAQDITPPDRVAEDPKCDREVTVYGYLRGTNLKPGTRAHLAGVGDFQVCIAWKISTS